ncbi:hypothetical protein ABZ044_32095, partial [Streptomyces werraensis]
TPTGKKVEKGDGEYKVVKGDTLSTSRPPASPSPDGRPETAVRTRPDGPGAHPPPPSVREQQHLVPAGGTGLNTGA